MKLSQLLMINAVIFLGAGIAFALYGPLMISLYGGLESGDGSGLAYWYAVSFARLLGAALFGLGLLLFAVKDLAGDPGASAKARRGVSFALLLANILGAITAISQAGVWRNSLAGWLTAGVCALLLAGYAYSLVGKSDEKAL